jgi:trans-2,3-dihydro-3-hydroxyanthranilate isomerase
VTPRQFRYDLVDVFTKTRLQGNPLAVFPSAHGISDVEMQQIAGELSLSETVFFAEPTTPHAAAKVRIFTPLRELDFAGHPTIGSAYVLSRSKTMPERFAIEENAGLIQIDVETEAEGEPVFWLTTPRLTFYETVEAAFCARLLNLSVDDIESDCPAQYASAGSPLLFICLTTPEAVDRARLQHAHLEEALGSVNSVGTFLFARKEPHSDSCFDVYSRMFAPQTGLPEDPATGGATGPLAGYMLRHGILPRRSVQFTSEQGVKMGRRSSLLVKLDIDRADVSIKVGGSVVAVAEGTFFLDERSGRNEKLSGNRR